MILQLACSFQNVQQHDFSCTFLSMTIPTGFSDSTYFIDKHRQFSEESYRFSYPDSSRLYIVNNASYIVELLPSDSLTQCFYSREYFIGEDIVTRCGKREKVTFNSYHLCITREMLRTNCETYIRKGWQPNDKDVMPHKRGFYWVTAIHADSTNCGSGVAFFSYDSTKVEEFQKFLHTITWK